MTAPRVDRPEIPAEYGVGKATGHVDWAHVEERLTDGPRLLDRDGRGGRSAARPAG